MNFLVMENPIRWLFLLHALCGAMALAIFMLPMLSKKGGRLHVRSGWIYTYAMVFVGLSALVITPWRVFLDLSRTLSSKNFATFLFFIAVFTLAALWYGLRALKHKARKDPERSIYLIGPPIAVIVCGLLVQIVGMRHQNTLLIIFPFIGHFSAVSQFRYWTSAPKTKRHWWYAHMNGMFTACIATITAFLVTALPRIWPSPIAESPILWIAPGLILGTVLNRWTKSYQSQFGDKE